MRQKVILVITKDDVGGAQKYVNDLASGLDLNKFEVKVLAGGRDLKFLSNAFRPYFLFLNDIAAMVELFLIFRREQPDVVHLNSSKAGVIGAFAAALARTRLIVFTAHGWVFNPDNALSFWRRHFYIWLHRLAAHCQNKIINVSEYDRRLALRHNIAPAEKLITIHNGLDYKNIRFLDKTTARQALFSKLPADNFKLHESWPWIGTVGRLVVEKDYETLIAAATLVPKAYFFILASGPELENLKFKIKSAGLSERVFIIENVVPAASYLRAFDIFVMSSIKEGLPYAVLEAMAAELPIIVTRVGGMTEIIEGRGLVMPPREPNELARAIIYFLEHPKEAKAAGAKARAFLEKELTLNKMIEATQKVYLDQQ